MLNASFPQKTYHKTILAIAVVSFVLIAGYLSLETQALTSDNLSGWAWSETIGWISFNSTNQGSGARYGVDVDQSGTINGYAWSEHIGWISFNTSELSGCPSGQCIAQLNRDSGEVSGWARALAADGRGWDGWIHLRGIAHDGSSYGVVADGCIWDGWAWGSDVIGWVHFKGISYGVIGTGDACERETAPPPEPPPIPPPSDEPPPEPTPEKPLTASCIVTPAVAAIGETVVWTADAKGGNNSYTYEWMGEAPLDGKTENPAPVAYTTTGTKNGAVTVRSGTQVITRTCNNTVTVGQSLSFDAFPLRIIRGDSSTLTWITSGFTSCVVNQNIGQVVPPRNGQGVVFPTQTTTYTMVCQPSNISESVTIIVEEGLPRPREVPPK